MKFYITLPNVWNIKKFSIFLISCLLAFTGAICLDSIISNDISLLIRQITASLFLIFIPGFIILRILRVRQVNPIENLVFSVGLSIAFLMFTGLCLNIILPIFGLNKPLSESNLIFSITLITISSMIFVYVTDKNFILDSSNKSTFEAPLAQLLFLVNIPVLSVLGANVLNTYELNFISLSLFLLISVVPLLVVIKFRPCSYPIAVFSLSLAILYNKSLVSMYITGWDIQVEYLLSNYVFGDSFWNMNFYSNINSVLSTCIFVPSFSKITKVSIPFVFKLIIPFLYSFAPLCLYRISQKQLSSQIAFLSTCLIMFSFVFCQVLNDLPRQQFAELFLCLFLLIVSDKKLTASVSKKVFLIIFIMSIVFSHYGLTYVFIFLLIVTFLISKLDNYLSSINLNYFLKYIFSYFSYNRSKSNVLQLNLLLLVISFSLFWHIFTASSSVFNVLVNIGRTVFENILTEFFSSDSSQAIYLITTKEVYLMHQITKYIHIVVLLFVSIGLFLSFIEPKENNFNREYFFYSLASYLLLGMVIALPFVANQLNFNRFYQISLLSLAPFFYLGIYGIMRVISPVNAKKASILICSLFLSVFLLFNSGFAYEISGEPSYMSLNASIDYPRFVTQEVKCATWFSQNYDPSKNIYCDAYRVLLFLGYGIDTFHIGDNEDPNYNIERNSKNGSYVFLGKENLLKNNIFLSKKLTQTVFKYETVKMENSTVPRITKKADKIYDEDFAKIYLYTSNTDQRDQ